MNGKEKVDNETQYSSIMEQEKFIDGADSPPPIKGEQLQVEEKKKTRSSCLQWLTLKLKLVEDGATPPNWKYIGLVFIALTLGYTETEKGTYAGIIASAVFAGRVVGSVFWGWLADRQGRKIVLLITISLNGLFAGTVGTAKAILYDISDNSNQALSMSMLSISWGMGLIVGPAVGGLLASPVKKWPNAFDENGLFGQFPYLLSSAFPFVTCCIIFVVVYLKFDETFIVKSHQRVNQELIISENETRGDNDENNSQNFALTEAKRNPILHLGRSMQSLHGDSETFAHMNKDLIQHQSKSDISEKNRNCMSHSVPDLVIVEQIPDNDAKLSKSLCNVASESLTNAPNKEVAHTFELTNNKNEEEYRFEKDQIHNAQNICLNRNNVKDIHSTKDQENCIPAAQENAKLLISDKADVNIQAADMAETESVCHCVEVICEPACCGALRKTSFYQLLR
ncbi:Protein ZINC INDUCED FACILITATOR 1 [Bulinus truncatus]|nr:Protein ZINC INDUCED FACILITATOR 1 [Bulinus truncatus]